MRKLTFVTIIAALCVLFLPPIQAQQIIVRGDQFVYGTASVGTSVRLLRGTGTPEGAVTAPVGTLFQRTDGGDGTTLYIKSTGAGNTGWTAAATSPGTAAPSTGSYITKVAEAGLSNEFALGSLASAILLNTTTTGVPVAYTGTTCTNQLIRVLSVLGVATCSTVTSSFVDASIGLTGNPLSQFAATTSVQLAGVLSDETGSGGGFVRATSPTITNPVIANITPGANFTLMQNMVTPFTSEETGAVANTLYLKAGNVGIGTAAPQDKLEIYAGAAPATIRLSNFATSNNFVRLATSGNLELGTFFGHRLGLFTSDSERLTIDGTGNVGIGTTAPSQRLDVLGNIALGSSGAGNPLAFSGTAPTVSSGFGTSPSVTAGTAVAFRLNVGTGGTASAGVIGLPTASTGWNCFVANITGQAANRADQRTVQTSSTTTTATVQNQTVSTGAALAWTASDILAVNCVAF